MIIFLHVLVLVSSCICQRACWVKLPHAFVSVCQATGEQNRANHLLGLLILHRSLWQGNEPHRVAESPHMTTVIGDQG